MTRNHHRHGHGRAPRPRSHRQPGMALAWACQSCAPQAFTGGHDAGDGFLVAPLHAHHVPELVAQGWILTEYPHQPSDIACLHYHLARWEGGHGDDCCGLAGA